MLTLYDAVFNRVRGVVPAAVLGAVVAGAAGQCETANLFGPRQDFATGSQPMSVAIGDLDGDGRPDLAIVNWTSTTVDVLLNQCGAPCIVDLNNDNALNFLDVQLFLNLYATGHLAADFTGDGVLDFFDVQVFLGLFAAGCP